MTDKHNETPQYTYLGNGRQADPRLDFGAAADNDTPEVIRNDKETSIRNDDISISHLAPGTESEDDAELSEEERDRKRIRELKKQADDAKRRADELEKEQQNYITQQQLQMAWPEGKDRLPGGLKVKPTNNGGKLTTKKDLSKAIDPRSKKDRKKLAQMIQQAVELTGQDLANNSPDVALHLVIETRKPLLKFERKTANPITGRKSLLPTVKSQLVHGAMEENGQLAQTAQEIADYLYGKDKNKQSKICIHGSYAQAKHALNQEKEDLKQKFINEYGEDPEELKKQKEQADHTRQELENSPANQSHSDDKTSNSSDPQKNAVQGNNGMRVRKSRQGTPASRPSGPSASP